MDMLSDVHPSFQVTQSHLELRWNLCISSVCRTFISSAPKQTHSHDCVGIMKLISRWKSLAFLSAKSNLFAGLWHFSIATKPLTQRLADWLNPSLWLAFILWVTASLLTLAEENPLWWLAGPCRSDTWSEMAWVTRSLEQRTSYSIQGKWENENRIGRVVQCCLSLLVLDSFVNPLNATYFFPKFPLNLRLCAALHRT